jgi:predicted RNase H-like nuclease
MRPVDRVAASVISWIGGGVQPANRSKEGMFDDAAPIWSFKQRLGATEDPERARTAPSGLFLVEVFPALALLSLDDGFFGRLSGPRYNPQRRKTFKIADWQAVVGAVRRFVDDNAIEDVDNWLDSVALLSRPTKPDQDKLDALLCAIIGLHWLIRDRSDSVRIGDSLSGYMVAPASPELVARLRAAGKRYGVPVN